MSMFIDDIQQKKKRADVIMLCWKMLWVCCCCGKNFPLATNLMPLGTVTDVVSINMIL